MAEYGLLSGLSANLGYDQRINDVRAREQLDRQAREEAIARAKLYAEDSKYNNAMNAFDNAKVKEYANQLLTNIARYTQENRDWEWNNEKRAEVMKMREGLKNNEHVIRGMAVDQQKAQLIKDMQEAEKNPQYNDIEALQEQYKQFENYEKTGNANGMPDQGIVPPVYNKPRPFIDLTPSLQQMGKSVQNGEIIRPKNGNIGEWYKKMPQEYLESLTNAAFQNHGRQIDVEAKKLGIVDPIEKRKWIAKQIESGFDDEYHFGDPNAAWQRGMAEREYAQRKMKESGKQPTYSSAYDETFSHPAGNITEDNIKKVWGNKPVSPVIGYDGTKVDLSNHEIDFKGGRFVKRNGIPFFIGDIRISPEEARQKGIITVDDEDDLKNQDISDRGMRIAAGFNGKASWEKFDKGDKKGLNVVVRYEMPINPNDKVARQKFDSFISPDKYVAPIENQQLFQDDNGNLFDASGKYVGKANK